MPSLYIPEEQTIKEIFVKTGGSFDRDAPDTKDVGVLIYISPPGMELSLFIAGRNTNCCQGCMGAPKPFDVRNREMIPFAWTTGQEPEQVPVFNLRDEVTQIFNGIDAFVWDQRAALGIYDDAYYYLEFLVFQYSDQIEKLSFDEEQKKAFYNVYKGRNAKDKPELVTQLGKILGISEGRA